MQRLQCSKGFPAQETFKIRFKQNQNKMQINSIKHCCSLLKKVSVMRNLTLSYHLKYYFCDLHVCLNSQDSDEKPLFCIGLQVVKILRETTMNCCRHPLL